MGVRGLKTFLERENQLHRVDIREEVEKWKRENPGQTATIVIDFLSLTHCVTRKNDDTIYGGQHQITLKEWKELLAALKATGAELVFFSDLRLQDGKSETWLSRRNEKFDLYTSLYELISAGANAKIIIPTVQERKGLTTKFYGMELVAQTFGEFKHSIQYECDLEIAQFAKNNKALAVLTNDTDFLIFEGSWKMWSTNDIEITGANQLITLEYNRKGLANICSLTQQHLPLFATLLSNDFTGEFHNELYRFHRTLGPLRDKFRNIARFVRGFNCDRLSDEDLKRIVSQIFGSSDKVQLFRQSIDSYKTDFPPATVDDPLERKLLKTNVYRSYMTCMSQNQGITMPFYDMRGGKPGANFPMMLADWLKRKIGVVRKQSKDDKFTFTLLMKKNINEFYKAYTEKPIYPDFVVPPLDQLYLGSENNDSDIATIRWKLIGFIMSLNDNVIAALKQLPKDFLLISTSLYALVKNGFIGELEADGILYTEHKVLADEIDDIEQADKLVAKNVRAAHLYNVVFSAVRENFTIAGLLSHIEEILQFDGVYYQNLMEKVDKMKTAERDTLFEPIKKYRIYAKN